MTSTNPLNIGETLAYPTPDGRFVIRMQHVRAGAYTVVVEQGTLRIAELSRTFAAESDARLFAREVSKRLKDGATVAEVVAAIQPAAELITAVTAHLALAAAAKALPLPQQSAILTADPDHVIHAGRGVTRPTLRAIAKANAGVLIYKPGTFTVAALRLNDYGQRIKWALADIRTHTLAA